MQVSQCRNIHKNLSYNTVLFSYSYIKLNPPFMFHILYILLSSRSRVSNTSWVSKPFVQIEAWGFY